MILISAGLVLAAVVLLIAGFVLAAPHLIMWSIVVSVLSAMFLVIGAFLRRHELFPSGGRAGEPATPPPGFVPPTTPVPHQAPLSQTQPGPVATPPSLMPRTLQQTATVPASRPQRPAAGGISPDAIVLVIPGRKRYHVAGCRQLISRDHEELTYEEAREEGFTPCTTCLPDAALGGRQLPPAADPEPVVPVRQAARPAVTEVTRELRSTAPSAAAPVADAPPKPEPAASTPSPAEPDPERLSGGARAQEPTGGWFARAETPADEPEATASERAGDQASSGSTEEPEGDEAATATKPRIAPYTAKAPLGTTPSSDATSSEDVVPDKAAEPSPSVARSLFEGGPGKPSASASPAPSAAASPTPDAPRDAKPVPESADEPESRPEPKPAPQAKPRPEPATQATARPEPASPTAPRPEPEAAKPRQDSKPKAAPESDPEPEADKPRPGTVKVIVGTRRYHSTACPLIRGAGDTGVETMSLGQAEAAGLTSCSVCQHDRETVS